jgi:hypothetical protein
MKCVDAREAIPGYARNARVSLGLRRHLSKCAACRTEAARYEQLLEALGELQGVVVRPPPGLVHALVSIPRRTGLAGSLWWRAGTMRGHVARNKGTYLSGAGVALAGVGAVVWRRRVATA